MTDEQIAKKYIETYIDYIEDDKWLGFFDSMAEDYPAHINHNAATLILNALKDAGIQWSEEDRKTVFYQGINAVLQNAFSSGETVYVYDLYKYDENQWINGASNWLGYSPEEFYDLLIMHPEKIKCGKLYGALIEVN